MAVKKGLASLKRLSISLQCSCILSIWKDTGTFPTLKRVCSVSKIELRTSTLSDSIWLKACQKQFVLRVQKCHGGADDSGAGIMFLLKNHRNTTKDAGFLL